jgi:hypothetical protein
LIKTNGDFTRKFSPVEQCTTLLSKSGFLEKI